MNKLLVLNRGGILSDTEVDYYNRGAKAQLQAVLDHLGSEEVAEKAISKLAEIIGIVHGETTPCFVCRGIAIASFEAILKIMKEGLR